jgi:hypothetical protein
MVPIQGHVSPGFEAVHEVFAENFDRRRELGGACCAFVQGEKSSTSGAVSETSRQASLGNRTRWWSSTRHRPLSRLAQLRRTSVHLLAGVRAAGQRTHRERQLYCFVSATAERRRRVYNTAAYHSCRLCRMISLPASWRSLRDSVTSLVTPNETPSSRALYK